MHLVVVSTHPDMDCLIVKYLNPAAAIVEHCLAEMAACHLKFVAFPVEIYVT